MDKLPNLNGLADPDNVSKKGTGKFTASYINWGRTLHDIRSKAQGWMPEMQTDIDGNEVHSAPDGSCYLLIRFTHIDGTMTSGIPHAIMDHKMNPLSRDRIGSRDISDSFVRGACKAAAALFGYAWQLWSKDDPLERTEEEDNEVERLREEQAIIKEGMIREATNNPLPKDQEKVPSEDLVDDTTAPEDWVYGKVIWPGKMKHTGRMLEDIAKSDLPYLRKVLKESYEILAENEPNLLEAVKRVVARFSEDGKQDFKEA
jgi:hypothetical protein